MVNYAHELNVIYISPIKTIITDLKANVNELTSYYRDNNSMTCPNTMAECCLLRIRHVAFEKHLTTVMQPSTMKKQIPEGLSCEVKNGENLHHVHAFLRLKK